MISISKKSSKMKIIIPLILILSSYFIYAYDLSSQAYHRDEKTINRGGQAFLKLILRGDLLNYCWNADPQQKLNSDTRIPNICINRLGWEYPSHSSLIRNFFAGVSQLITTDGKGASGFAKDTYDFSQGRFFAPIFGALTVGLAFLIGNSLFNRFVGVSFALILLFHIAWMWNSRVTMAEVYTSFFMLLTVFLLIYSLKNKGTITIKLLILSAIAFGLSVNSKYSAYQLVFLIMSLIIFRNFPNKNINLSQLKNKNQYKTIFFAVFFLGIILLTVVAVNPYFYPDPIRQFSELRDGAARYVFITPISLENDNVFRTLATFHTILVPAFVDYYPFYYEEIPRYKIGWEVPQTYSSIPISIFFFVGLAYISKSIKNKNFSFAEFIVLIWFSSFFIIEALTVKNFQLDRYYLPAMFPMMLISAYGLWNFIKNLKFKKIKILFTGFFIYVHAITTLSLWEIMYNSPGIRIADYPNSDLSLQTALMEPIVIVSSIGFVIFCVIMVFFKFLKPVEKIGDL